MSAQLLDETGKTLIDTVPVVVDGNQQDTASSAAYETAPGQPIFGARESSVYPIKDLDDKQKVFYCFPDMRVRNLGRFRLRFMLFYLPDEDSPFPRANTILATVTSDVFTVYNARDFPGIGKTTALSKKLSSQGVPIPNRNKDRLKSNDEDSTDG
ncbi:hypothetical protein IWW47_003543 [Coemansia sp. RSA 2052]|nr:hypothetical protein GGF38_000082 [Coemansia sp. RSA 25]KAJ2497967.1 hypothetical protein IWW47_003543 [Coemansia sp. RSA 2052]